MASLAALSLVLAAACGSDDDAEPPEAIADDDAGILAQAEDEGEVIWYTTVGLDVADAIAEAFEAEYDGIEVTVYRETASRTYQRFRQELSSGATTADVFDTSVLSIADELKNEDLLVQYTPENEQNVIEDFRGLDPDGYYHQARVLNNVIAYNTDALTAEEAPQNWEDLLDPQWKGRLGTGHPGASGAVNVWAVFVRDAYGAEYLEALGEQDVLVGQSIRDTIPWVGTDERSVVVTLDGEIASRLTAGDPIALVYPEDGAVTIPSPAGITTAATHPAAARLFMNWLFSTEVSEIYLEAGFLPIVEGVTPPSYVPDEYAATTPTLDTMNEFTDSVVTDWRRIFGV